MKIITWPMMVAVAILGFTAALRAADSTATNAFDKITYRDSGGFTGRGTGKSLVLTSDGKLEAKTRTGAAQAIQLEAPELAEINKAVAAVDWATVQPQYRTPRAADLINNDLTVVIRGKTYQTHADQMAKLPAGLKELFTRLDAVYRRAIAAPKQ